MRQEFIVSLIALFLVIIGLWGQYVVSPTNLTVHLTTSLYQIFMLFLLSGDWTLELSTVPPQIELVRFTAPLVAIASLILAVASNTQTTMANFLARFSKRHTIIVGLGEKSFQLLLSCDEKNDVIVIERDPENLLIHRVRELGAKVIIADVFEGNVFERTNLRHASVLIALTGNDGTNVELALKARDHIRDQLTRETPLKVNIHLNEIGLARQLEYYPKFFSDYSIAEISFFSVYDLSARLLLRDYPPEIFADVAGQKRVHLALYNFNRLSEKLMIEAALIGQYANGQQLMFSIFDQDASNQELRLRSEYPNLERICDYQFIQQQSFGPHMFTGDTIGLLPTITLHITCLETDEDNLNLALILRTSLLEKRASNAPIMVRMQQSSGLAQLLESNTGGAEIPDGLYPFGMLDQVLHVENVLNNRLDKLAHSIHHKYLEAQMVSNNEGSTPQSWSELPQLTRKQNLLNADHWPVRLRAIRFQVSREFSPTAILLEAEAVLQAKMEHNRYVSHKFFEGWHYGETRIEEAKVSPFLVPWDQLSSQQQEIEIEEAEAEPAYFATKLENYIKRSLVIGLCGDGLNEIDIENESLLQQIRETFRTIKKSHEGCHFKIMSSLAEGAERILAEIALVELDASLYVPLPLPYDLYISDFSTNDSITEFKQMIGKASYYYEMPMRFGNIQELALNGAADNTTARENQYALAGAYICQRSDILVAIHNDSSESDSSSKASLSKQFLHWFEHGNIESKFQFPDYYLLPAKRLQAVVINPDPSISPAFKIVELSNT